MLLEYSWELLQNAMVWILNYVCRDDDEGREEGEDARKDARGQLRRGEEAFFVVIGKVCRRKVSIYSLQR